MSAHFDQAEEAARTYRRKLGLPDLLPLGDPEKMNRIVRKLLDSAPSAGAEKADRAYEIMRIFPHFTMHAPTKDFVALIADQLGVDNYGIRRRRDERAQNIRLLASQGLGVREIARRLQTHPGTVSRTLKDRGQNP